MTVSRKIRLALCLTALLALAGCGKKGALIPPEALAPAPINDLRVRQRGDQIQASWSAPTREEGGRRLQDLAGFILLRHEVLPPNQDCDLCPDAYRIVSRVELDYLKDVRRLGERYLVTDRNLTVGTSYRYKIRSLKSDGTNSRDSNKVQLAVHTPPPPPTVSVESGGTGVTVTFSAPPLLEGTLVGFDVYRRNAGAESPLVPLNSAPVAAGRFVDQMLQHGATYGYCVRSVVQIGNDIVESAPSAEVLGGLVEPQ